MMKGFIVGICLSGLTVCTISMLALIANSLAMHDYHVVLTILTLVMAGFFIATAQVICG